MYRPQYPNRDQDYQPRARDAYKLDQYEPIREQPPYHQQPYHQQPHQQPHQQQPLYRQQEHKFKGRESREISPNLRDYDRKEDIYVPEADIPYGPSRKSGKIGGVEPVARRRTSSSYLKSYDSDFKEPIGRKPERYMDDQIRGCYMGYRRESGVEAVSKYDPNTVHSRRNEHIMKRLQQKTVQPPYERYQAQKENPSDAYRNPSDGYRSPSDGYRNATSQNYEPRHSRPSQTPDRLVQKSTDRPAERNRKESFKNLQTPEKIANSYFEPGSSERKQSLIEKSQLLRQKLNKLTNNGEDCQDKTKERREERKEERREGYRPDKNGGESEWRQRREEGLEGGWKEKTEMSREVLREKMKSVMSREAGQDDSLSKISVLNERINERLQAIINNFGKK